MAEAFTFFREEDEALFQQGWPHLRVLVDGNKADKDPAASAKKAIESAEPVVGVRWPRETAKHFLLALIEATGGESARDPARDDVRAFLDLHVPKTHLPDFQVIDALFLYEAFLGTDVVAAEVTRRLGAIEVDADHPAAWALTFLRLRHGAAAATPPRVASDDPGTNHEWPDARAIWLGGPQQLAALEKRLDDAPAWRLRRTVEELAPLRHPAIVRVMQRLAGLSASKKSASAWLSTNAEYVAAVDPDEDRPRRRSPKKLEATLKKVLATFAKDMEKARGTEAKERKAIAKAIAAYVDIRSLAEEPIPSAGVRRFLSLSTLDPSDTERTRWTQLIDESLTPYG
jgi:hypothetical protein